MPSLLVQALEDLAGYEQRGTYLHGCLILLAELISSLRHKPGD